MLATHDRIELPETLDDLLRRIEASFSMVRMDGRITERAQRFSPAYPRDPGDRIIGATALVYAAILVKADRKFASRVRSPAFGNRPVTAIRHDLRVLLTLRC